MNAKTAAQVAQARTDLQNLITMGARIEARTAMERRINKLLGR